MSVTIYRTKLAQANPYKVPVAFQYKDPPPKRAMTGHCMHIVQDRQRGPRMPMELHASFRWSAASLHEPRLQKKALLGQRSDQPDQRRIRLIRYSLLTPCSLTARKYNHQKSYN